MKYEEKIQKIRSLGLETRDKLRELENIVKKEIPTQARKEYLDKLAYLICQVGEIEFKLEKEV